MSAAINDDGPALTAVKLRELLDYDETSGIFTRRVRTSNRIKAGDRAGTPDANGYCCIRLEGATHKAHRLAWLYVHGVWPSGEIDHINGVKSDNRIANLRDVTKSVNQQNRRRVRGYNRDGKQWKAQIRADGVTHHLGCFKTEDEAHRAYLAAKERLHTKARTE